MAERLFEPLGDVIFCVKDLQGRYTTVNGAFLARVGLRFESEVVGKLPGEVFAEKLAAGFVEQDREVLEGGVAIEDQLERVTNEDGSVGWYLAHKFPLTDGAGKVTGLVGISQDLHAPTEGALELSGLGELVAYIRGNLDAALRVDALAAMAGLSEAQLERRMKRVFRLSPKQFVTKARVELAERLLRETAMAIGEVALECGFADQSAFSRQFKATVGVTPGEGRRSWKGDGVRG